MRFPAQRAIGSKKGGGLTLEPACLRGWPRLAYHFRIPLQFLSFLYIQASEEHEGRKEVGEGAALWLFGSTASWRSKS